MPHAKAKLPSCLGESVTSVQRGGGCERDRDGDREMERWRETERQREVFLCVHIQKAPQFPNIHTL